MSVGRTTGTWGPLKPEGPPQGEPAKPAGPAAPAPAAEPKAPEAPAPARPAGSGLASAAAAAAVAAAGPGGAVISILIRAAIEKTGQGGKAPASPAKRGEGRGSGDALAAGPRLERERRRDPAAGDRFAANARTPPKDFIIELLISITAFDKAGAKAVEGTHGRARATGRISGDITGVRGSGEARADYGIDGEKSWSFRSRALEADARVRGDLKAYAAADGDFSIDRTGISARGHAEAGLRARIDIDASFRTAGATIGGERVDLNGKVQGYAEVGAYASADADIAATYQPPRLIAVAEAKAFAGAKAGVTGSIGIGDFVRVDATAEAWAGAGAEAGVKLGYDKGKLKVGFNLGAALEVGAGANVAVEVDVKKAVKAVSRGLTGGLIDVSFLLDKDGKAGKKPPVELLHASVLFPPRVYSHEGSYTHDFNRAAESTRAAAARVERAAGASGRVRDRSRRGARGGGAAPLEAESERRRAPAVRRPADG